MDLLVAALGEQSRGPWHANPGNPQGWQQVLPGYLPPPGRNYGEINVPTVVRKGTGRMNVPSGPGTPKSRGGVVEGRFQPTRREASPWEENIVSMAGLEGSEED